MMKSLGFVVAMALAACAPRTGRVAMPEAADPVVGDMTKCAPAMSIHALLDQGLTSAPPTNCEPVASERRS